MYFPLQICNAYHLPNDAKNGLLRIVLTPNFQEITFKHWGLCPFGRKSDLLQFFVLNNNLNHIAGKTVCQQRQTGESP